MGLDVVVRLTCMRRDDRLGKSDALEFRATSFIFRQVLQKLKPRDADIDNRINLKTYIKRISNRVDDG